MPKVTKGHLITINHLAQAKTYKMLMICMAAGKNNHLCPDLVNGPSSECVGLRVVVAGGLKPLFILRLGAPQSYG